MNLHWGSPTMQCIPLTLQDPNVLQLVHWYLRVWEMMLRTPLDALPASVAASIRQRVATPAWGPQSGAQAKMVQALAQGLDVKLNSPVTKVDYGKSGVTVTTQSGAGDSRDGWQGWRYWGHILRVGPSQESFELRRPRKA